MKWYKEQFFDEMQPTPKQKDELEIIVTKQGKVAYDQAELQDDE
ncbi:MAG: hypothetical protein SAK29_07295 [Scytonema sp. PMC 1069.18]|nr:hypothetical protein [Scytonema sp. PMC 1069.18]MEC4885648.1 hypothetical protein [Scytonema sp. PMC 1070.18]